MRDLEFLNEDGQGQTDESSMMMNDLLMGVLGVILLILMTAMVMIGVPDVSRAEALELKDTIDGLNGRVEAVTGEKKQVQDKLDATIDALKVVRKERDAKDREAKEKERDLKDAEARLRMIRQTLNQTNPSAGDITTTPTDVVVIVDSTGSMSEHEDAILGSVYSIAEVGSRICPEFRIGLVFYEGGVCRFPLTPIEPTQYGRVSRGMAQLKQFNPSCSDGTGGANIEAGFDAGLRMLEQANSSNRKVLVLIGDVGPWERGNDEAIAARMREDFRRFCARSAFHQALFLFADSNNQNARTIAFFKGMASIAGENGMYSDDVSQIAATVIEAVIGPKGN